MTCTPRTKRFSGKRRSMRSTDISIPVASDAMVTTAADPVYMAHFIQDGVFWQFLAYCAGVGGSMLIIGSAAGVVVMGLEGINFIWYLKRISLLALAGYLSGAAVYILQNVLLGI